MLSLSDLLIAKAINGDGGGGGGGEAVLINKSISANGTYNASADDADGYKKVTVNVPNTYAAGDEGKVVSNGALVAQTAHAEVTANGTIDTTLNNSVTVNVPTGGTDGFIDFTWNDSVKVTSGSMEENGIRGMYILSGDKMGFPLKKPIPTVKDDVITVQLNNISRTSAGYASLYLIGDISYMPTVNDNFNMGTGTSKEFTYTVVNDSLTIFGMVFGSRTGGNWQNLNTDISILVNGTPVF